MRRMRVSREAILNSPDQTTGKEKERGDKVKRAANDYPYYAERQQDQPDERVEDESSQGKWPANDEKNAEQQELEHQVPPAEITHGAGKKFRYRLNGG